MEKPVPMVESDTNAVLMVDEVVYAVPMVKSDTNSVLMVDKAVNAVPMVKKYTILGIGDV